MNTEKIKILIKKLRDAKLREAAARSEFAAIESELLATIRAERNGGGPKKERMIVSIKNLLKAEGPLTLNQIVEKSGLGADSERKIRRSLALMESAGTAKQHGGRFLLI